VKTALILGITSDIGHELAIRLVRDGWEVIGTCRTSAKPRNSEVEPWTLIPCDFSTAKSVDQAIRSFLTKRSRWALVVVAVGSEEPIGPFFECDSSDWERGLHINALAPLRFLKGIHDSRDLSDEPCVAFFSGSGTNKAVPAYSSYCVSKILLIKMCELLDAECSDTNFFIIGPGIVRTKIHQQTLDASTKAGENYKKVVDFLASEDPGTNHDDIYRCLLWCKAAGKSVMGGRNIALAHDEWRDDSSSLLSMLKADRDLYRLRRHGNHLKFTIPTR